MEMKTRWLRLAVTSIALLFSGILYAWSVINFPFADMNFSPAALKLNYTITMCAFCSFGFFSGLLSKKIAPRIRILIAAVLTALGFVLASCVNAGDTLLLYAGYGICIGGGIGIVYNVVISAMNAWFPDRKGLCTGIMMMAFGFSTLLIGNPMANAMTAFGWRYVYRIAGVVLFVILLLASFFSLPPAPGTALPAPKRKSAANTAEDIPAREMLRRLSFWKLFCFFALLAAVGSTAISGAKGQFEEMGFTASAALLAGAVTVANGLGRIVSGTFYDSFGLRKTQYLTSGVAICATLLTWLGYLLPVPGLCAAGLMLCGFSYGFCPTISAAFASGFYGMKNFPLNFSILNLILIPASFVPTLLSGCTSSVTFLVLLCASCVGLVLNLTIRRA